jgi:hypothetical protein
MRLMSQNNNQAVPLLPLSLNLITAFVCLIALSLQTTANAKRLPNISSDDGDEVLNIVEASTKEKIPSLKRKATIKPTVTKSPSKIPSKVFNQAQAVKALSAKVEKKPVYLQPIPSSNVINDQLLNQFYEALAQGKSKWALNKINQMINLTPNYKLLYMIRADLLVMMSQKNTLKTTRGTLPVLPTLTIEQNKRFQELHREARLRMGAYTKLNELLRDELVPKALIKLADNEPYAVVVDGTSSRLYLYKNQIGSIPKLVKDFYITQGKLGMNKSKEGDNRTPVGVYFTSGRLSDKLSDFYGSGALPLDYPNVFDKSLGRTGHGIWLHGSPPDTYARSPYASEGCVVLANPDMEALLALPITASLPVVVTNTIEWVEPSEIKDRKEDVLSLLTKWNRLPNNSAVKINFSSVVAIEYPNQSNLLLIKFAYTNATGGVEQKQLYWKKNNFTWQLTLEN